MIKITHAFYLQMISELRHLKRERERERERKREKEQEERVKRVS